MVGEFFRAPENTAFVIALAVLAALSILAVLATFLGFVGHGHDLDHDFDHGVDFDHGLNVDHGLDVDHGVEVGHDVHIDHGAEVAHDPGLDRDLHVDWGHGSFAANLFEFLGITAIPASIFVVISSGSFFVTGFSIQWLAISTTGAFLPGWIAIMPATVVTVFICRTIGKVFARAKLKLDTTAIHSNTFQGRIATVTQGTAKSGLPAQAKFVDQFGQTHYVLVEPLHSTETFSEGAAVALMERQGPKFFVVSGKLEDILAMDSQSESHEAIENK
ncbi:MAG: DUF1449 family protein [Fimbriimonadaceae bacterium]|nr:DUF1449 family protein [Fimbriimonadaceae bacterium]